MRRRILIVIVSILAALALIGGILSRTPVWGDYFAWRFDFALAYARGVINPVGKMPTALPPPAMAVTSQPSPTPTATLTPVPVTPTAGPTATATPSPTPIPASASLDPPAYEKQDINNCGPATLAMNLRYYGWEGDQFDIAELLKPQREDRNVNVEELIYYVRTRAGWLNAEFRVGGDLETLKRLLAAGLPVMVEESFYFEEPYWPNDDLWAAHYNLLNGYDDASQTFTGQDSFVGPDRQIPYETLQKDWQSFNYVYILIYPPEKQATVESILGEHWDVDANRQHALDRARTETENQPDNAYAWFNLGTNLVYFERYNEAAGAYDKARQLGLPQRMLRYQFGPFFAYFHNRRMDDLAALTDYALQITPNSEEALLWRGWMHFRQGDSNAAAADFQAALAENPNYQDASYALDFVRQSQ